MTRVPVLAPPFVKPEWLDGGHLPAGGVETSPRGEVSVTNAALTSGSMRLSYFTPQVTRTCTQAVMYSGSAAAGATPTLVRFGYYTVAANGDIALACAIANDTGLFAGAAWTEYVRPFSTDGGLPSSFTFVAGQRYAGAVLVVSGASMPQMISPPNVIAPALAARAPRIGGIVSGQTDLPTSVVNASITSSSTRPYMLAIA